MTNSSTAWLYGASSVNCALLGIGERCGNTPLEAMVMEYASLRGTTDGMDTTVITEIADYFRNEMHYDIPPRTPFVGRDFNVTKAGIHADGLMKDEEIYNIFNTEKLLGRPARVLIDAHSGLAGIAHWLKNSGIPGVDPDSVDKKSPVIAAMKDMIDKEYLSGRTTTMSDPELIAIYEKCK